MAQRIVATMAQRDGGHDGAEGWWPRWHRGMVAMMAQRIVATMAQRDGGHDGAEGW